MTIASDQASRLRALMDSSSVAGGGGVVTRTPRTARTISIASGKGGVGKTTLAVNLGIAFALGGKRIALLDGDLGLGNADLMCGLAPGKHLGHVLDGACSIDAIAKEVTAGFRIIPGGSGLARLADLSTVARQRLQNALNALEQSSDLVLVDCGAGIGPLVLDLIAASDLSLIVTTPEPTSVADAYGLIKSIVAHPVGAPAHLGLVINQVRERSEAQQVHTRMSAVCDRFLGKKLELMGMIGWDLEVSRSIRHRRPMLLNGSRHGAANDVQFLSGAILKTILGDLPETSTTPGVWARLLRSVRR